MHIRAFDASDMPAVGALWESCRLRGETLLRPFSAGYFREKFIDTDCYEAPLCLVYAENGTVRGLIFGARKHAFLNRETDENTPGYITLMMVSPEWRNRGIGSALLTGLEDAFRRLGKTQVDKIGRAHV